jgi:hypothetical protein
MGPDGGARMGEIEAVAFNWAWGRKGGGEIKKRERLQSLERQSMLTLQKIERFNSRH